MPRTHPPRYSFKGLAYQMQTFHLCHLQFMASWLEDEKEYTRSLTPPTQGLKLILRHFANQFIWLIP